MKVYHRDTEPQRRRTRVIPSGVQPATNLLLRITRVLRAALGEIFDESAYARFLERNGLASSGNAYVAFLREKSGGRPRPRCC